MTIKEAIKLLRTAKEGFPANDTEPYYKAMELGIGALGRVKDNPIVPRFHLRALLPGETKD